LFAVYAVDPVGNKGQPTAANFTVDNTPPTFTTINFPSATNQTSITVTFEAADAGSGLANITCRFRELNPAQSNASATSQDAAESASEWRPCTSPQQYQGLQEGRYGLTLRAADRAGLVKQVGVVGSGPGHGHACARMLQLSRLHHRMPRAAVCTSAFK
jgi:hypothetical protein